PVSPPAPSRASPQEAMPADPEDWMPKRYSYITVDVFTDRAFAGNPLAVVTDARGLTPEHMQAIAAEFNDSESTFVLPPDDPSHIAGGLAGARGAAGAKDGAGPA